MGKKNFANPAMFKHMFFKVSQLLILLLRCPREWLFMQHNSFHPPKKLKWVGGEAKEESDVEVYKSTVYGDHLYNKAVCISVKSYQHCSKIELQFYHDNSFAIVTDYDPLVNCYSTAEVLSYMRYCAVFDVPLFNKEEKIAVSDYINAYLNWLTLGRFKRYESTAPRIIDDETRGDVTVYPLDLLDEVIKIWAYVILDPSFRKYVMHKFGRSRKKYLVRCEEEARQAEYAVKAAESMLSHAKKQALLAKAKLHKAKKAQEDC